jgi:hypothetical protein
MPDDSAPEAGPPAALLQMMTGYWASQALYVAANAQVQERATPANRHPRSGNHPALVRWSHW